MIRPQYHFRESKRGLLAWDVRRLISLSAELPVREILLSEISELDETHWHRHVPPTCRSVLEHIRLIQEADPSLPIILDRSGRVMDGMHRVCNALMRGDERIPCVQFASDPDPDYVGRQPDTLPYDE